MIEFLTVLKNNIIVEFRIIFWFLIHRNTKANEFREFMHKLSDESNSCAEFRMELVLNNVNLYDAYIELINYKKFLDYMVFSTKNSLLATFMLKRSQTIGVSFLNEHLHSYHNNTYHLNLLRRKRLCDCNLVHLKNDLSLTFSFFKK